MSDSDLAGVRVAMVVPGPLTNTGGVELCAKRMLESLDEWGCKTSIVWRRRKSDDGEYGLAVNDTGSSRALNRILFGARATWLALKQDPQILHVQATEYGWALPAQLVLRKFLGKKRPKILVTSHGSLSRLLIETTSAQSLQRRALIALTRVLEGLVYRVADVVVPVSDHIGDELRNQGFTGRVDVIANAINTDLFTGGGTEASTPYLVWTGRDAPYKNPQGAVAVMARMATGSPDLELRMVGDFVLEAPANVVCVGRKSQEELATLLRGSLGLLSTSLYEGDPLAVKEALSCGVPVVVTPFASQGVVDGINGFTFNRQLRSPADADEFASIVKRLVADEALRENLRSGAAASRNQLTPEYEREKYLGVYKTLMSIN